jgi:hypothetical protein
VDPKFETLGAKICEDLWSSVVPANGCLATLLMRWSYQPIEDSSPNRSFTRRENAFRQVKGNLRFPLTVTYHGCPPSVCPPSVKVRELKVL